jgi:hypothetical protein
MIDKMIELNNLFDLDFNLELINLIQNQRSWILDPESRHLSSYENEIESSSVYCDSGFVLLSYAKSQIDYLNNHNANLTDISKIIFNVSIKKLKTMNVFFKHIELDRIMFNYYNRSSCGTWHEDMPNTNNYCSFLYYLNTCDGYTEFENIKINSESGKGVFFNSNMRHRGVGPTKDKRRFTLNITFRYEL